MLEVTVSDLDQANPAGDKRGLRTLTVLIVEVSLLQSKSVKREVIAYKADNR
jgi:hypothetical protein